MLNRRVLFQIHLITFFRTSHEQRISSIWCELHIWRFTWYVWCLLLWHCFIAYCCFVCFVYSVLISAPGLGVYYCQQLTLSVCPDVTLSGCLSVFHKLQIASYFLFLDGIEPFFGRQLSMTPSTKLVSSIFDLGPLMPKIYSPKFAQNRL